MSEMAFELIAHEKRFCRDDVARIARQIAATLGSFGFAEGDRVALSANPSAETILALVGLFRAGMVAFPFNPRFPIAARKELLSRFGCRAVLLRSEEEQTLSGIRSMSYDMLTRGDAQERSVDLPEDRLALIVASSGSTGQPKGVVLSWEALWLNAVGSNMNLAFNGDHRWLLSLPLFHVGGLGILFRAMAGGGAVVLTSEDTSLADQCQRHEITHLSLVPRQLSQLLDDCEAGGIFLPHLKAILVGGSAIPFALVERAHKLGLPIHTSYGLSEMGSQVTTSPPQESIDGLRTSGKLLTYRELKILSDGEIAVRGRTLFAGYVSETGFDRSIDEAGWFHTGDIGHLDLSGRLTVTGRKDNLFISGGENIYPEVIEKVIQSAPGVEDAVVVPVNTPPWGDRPAAFVCMREGEAIDISRLKDLLAEQLPKFMLPDHFLVWPEGIQSGLKPSRPYFAAVAREQVRKRQ